MWSYTYIHQQTRSSRCDNQGKTDAQRKQVARKQKVEEHFQHYQRSRIDFDYLYSAHNTTRYRRINKGHAHLNHEVKLAAERVIHTKEENYHS